jgi:hypothetical protein
MVAALAAAAVLAVVFASPAGAYGGGAGHDTWQVGDFRQLQQPVLLRPGPSGRLLGVGRIRPLR